jgi:SET domain-containing protein
MPRKKAFRVGRSRTGLGLFATERIEKRTFIVEYKGPWLTTEQADKLEARGNRYLYEINSRWTIDGSSRKNIGRYANHSCRPNSESHRIDRKVVLRAIKAINPGDEITYNYGRDYFLNVITPRGCKCVKCREKRSEARRAQRAKKRMAKRRAAKKRLGRRRSLHSRPSPRQGA